MSQELCTTSRIGRLVVGAAIVDDLTAPSRLLAVRRVAPPEIAGGWEFPGGKVEEGETPEGALVREVDEELGCGIDLGECVGRFPLTKPGWEMDVYFAVVTRGEPTLGKDHDAQRWLVREELFDVPWLVADLPIVEQIVPLLQPGE